MAVDKDFILAFNRGVMSPLARSRADIKRAGMAAETQMNFVPRTMGPMALRPGFQYIGPTAIATGGVKHIPFVFSNTDTSLIEVTDQSLRFRTDDALVTREAVTTAVTNGTFDSDITGWTDTDQGAAVSSWLTGGFMSLIGTGTQGAQRYQALTIITADQAVVHALRIIVTNGTVFLRVGTTTALDDIVGETALGTGVHSIAFTPGTNTVYVTFFNRSIVEALIDSCEIEATGVLAINTSVLDEGNFDELRYTQSGDVIFLARGTLRAPYKIERRASDSWSFVEYLSIDGPYRPENVAPITLTPSALNGNITLTASQAIFQSGNVGSLYQLVSTGQTRTASLSALDDVTEAIRVTGITNTRIFDIDISGTWVGTVTLQQSIAEEGNWTDLVDYTSNQDTTYDDGLDNQIAYYRLKMTIYTSGTATAVLFIKTGSITGVVRVDAFASGTVVTADVVRDLGATTPTRVWSEGAWSPRRGYPSAVAFYQARLWWAGKDKIWASVTDDFTNFDPETIGDSGPINRSIGTGPVDTINWLVPTDRLIMGAQGAEFVARSNGFDEPITPANFNLRDATTFGSAAVAPVKIDDSVVFVDRTGARIMQSDTTVDKLATTEISVLTPEICLPEIKTTAVQRRPDTRVHFVRCDGTAVVLVYDKVEQVNCFITVETEGLIEDVAVLPNTPEDDVYYTVVRVVNGAVVRYLEKWAYSTDAVGGSLNKMADSFITYSGDSTATINGLEHLEGKSVVAWGNSKDLGTYVVASGSITLSEDVTCAVVGLSYYADFLSAKLSFLSGAGPHSLSKKRRLLTVALHLQDTHKQGIQYGSDFDHLDNLPLIENEAAVADDFMWNQYDEDPVVLNGTLENDTRLALRATAPRPCTVKAAIIDIVDA